jgi:hypothetical protein
MDYHPRILNNFQNSELLLKFLVQQKQIHCNCSIMGLKQFDGVVPVRGLNLVVNRSILQQFISSNMHITIW